MNCVEIKSGGRLKGLIPGESVKLSQLKPLAMMPWSLFFAKMTTPGISNLSMPKDVKA
jgi:hypothetical protein